MCKSSSIRFLVFAVLAFWAVGAFSQQTPAKFTMQQVVFKGTRVFTNEHLVKATGLKIGGSFTQQDLVDVANKLGSIGVFSKVSYRVGPTFAEFYLIDNPRLLPVRFDNCVWMSDEQVLAALKDRQPFFMGQVPEEGSLAEDLGKQFEAVLADKGIKASVQFMPLIENGSSTAITYTIIAPRIEVSAIHFEGASPEVGKAFDEAIKKVLGRDYSPTLLPRVEDDVLKPILQQRGYLQGRFGPASLKLVSAPADPVAKVEFSLPVQEGAQYRISSLSVNGTDPIALEAAKKLSTFKTGDVANMTRFRAEIATLGSAYLSAGYMNAKVRAVPTLDEAAHTVSFNIDFVPGEVYKLAKLEIQGLDDAQKAKLKPVWMMNPGDTYDPTYAPKFLHKNQSNVAFLNGFYRLAWTQKVHDDTRTVELYVTFQKSGDVAQ